MFSKSLASALAVVVVSSVALTAGVSTASADIPGYWTSKSGDIWRTGDGECWRTRFWKSEYAVAECGDVADADGDAIADGVDACPNTPKGVKVDVKGCELDSDGDGVVDSKDSCSATVAGVEVDARGCKQKAMDSDGDGVVDAQDRCPKTAPGVSVNATGCEPDSDGDGVADSLDRCSNTAVGVGVDAKGCELDGDGDGVVDSKDRCPNSVGAAMVDASGCKLEENIVLKGVNFKTGSDLLASGSSVVLDEMAATLKRYPSMRVEIAGYTDSSGAASSNQVLSQKRAEAVMKYLLSNGVPEANLTAKGYGPNAPIADNGTRAGRAENRRVELHILER